MNEDIHLDWWVKAGFEEKVREKARGSVQQ